MKTSATVKILLALFLGVFLWYVFISIQAPRTNSQPEEPAPELRRELLSRMEDVLLEIGAVTVSASMQENYKSGEVHFRDFKMTHEGDTRTVEITGMVAQTRFEGVDIEFMEMHGDNTRAVRVVSSDGLDLTSQTLNYVDAQKRIFTQTPVRFKLKNLEGRADSFSYSTETRLLELQGRVEAVYYPEVEKLTEPLDEVADETVPNPPAEDEPSEEPEEDLEEVEAAIPPIEQRPTEISCRRLVFDQDKHFVLLSERVFLSQEGGSLRAEEINAELTEDNSQFVRMVATGVRSRLVGEEPKPEDELADVPEENTSEEAVEEPEGEPTSLSHRIAGIRNLRSRKLTLAFTTGDENALTSILAEGNAMLELVPTGEQRTEEGATRKRLEAERIEAAIGPGGTGLKNLRASTPEGLSSVLVEPVARRRRARGGENDPQPKKMTAPEIDAEINQETGDFNTVIMSGGIEMTQGETTITGESGRYMAEREQLQVDGDPLLVDPGKRVSADSMLVSLEIGDLAADGSVHSTFYPPEDESQVYVFAIGEEPEETSIAAGSLRLDYRNNVLRYAGGSRVLQGESTIDSESLTIYMTESRMIATGTVKASLVVPKASEVIQSKGAEAGAADGADAATTGNQAGEETAEQASATTTLQLQSGLLEFDKENDVLRLAKQVQAVEGDMQISAERLRYELGGEGKIQRSYAQGDVRVTIGPKVISGDKAEYYVAEQVLVVQGKDVKLEEAGRLESNHHKLTFDIANDTLRFDARADQLLKTRITTN